MVFSLLWIEDDPNDILLGERMLRKTGFPAPFVARDGEEAIAYLDGRGEFEDRLRYPLPDLVLSDLKLPRVSGFDVLRWMRDRDGFRRIPVVILTSSRQRHDIDLAYDCGANAYLVKPIETRVLGEVFRSFHRFWVEQNLYPTAGVKQVPVK